GAAALMALFSWTPLHAEGAAAFQHPVAIGGGRQLNMVCTGTGAPTVVFLQGHTGDISNWRKVKTPVAALTRTCFYDRAGMGYSDPSPRPMTAENIVDDLHTLLRAGGIKTPVVLAGHSMGGLFATLYADKYPKDVAGLVLADPSFDGQYDYAVRAEERKSMARASAKRLAQLDSCAKLAEDGQLSAKESHGCFHVPPDLTPDARAYVMQQFLRAPYYAGVRSELENYIPVKGRTVDGDQEKQARRNFGDLPVIVLTGGKTFDNGPGSADIKNAMKSLWKRGHDALAARSTRGENIVLADSTHWVQLDRPDAVVDAIREVVSQARP
ncbi:MAG TPA: alpha/beta hydrolase, partial [Rhizomicrobium sp.]